MNRDGHEPGERQYTVMTLRRRGVCVLVRTWGRNAGPGDTRGWSKWRHARVGDVPDIVRRLCP